MSRTDQFWQYAKEAIISASRAQTEDERRDLLDLGGPGLKQRWSTGT
jgi:hypothetical protein